MNSPTSSAAGRRIAIVDANTAHVSPKSGAATAAAAPPDAARQSRQRTVLAVEGMHCGSCVARVEKALKQLPGVDEVAANLATEKVTIDGHAGSLPSLDALVAALEKAGYRVPQPEAAPASAAPTASDELLNPPAAAAFQDAASAQHLSSGASAPQPVSAANSPYLPGKMAGARATSPRVSRETAHLIAAVVLSLPLVLPMLAALFGAHWMLPPLWQWLLATPVQFWLGARFYRGGFLAARAGAGNMDLLVALGTSAAYVLSLYLWLSAPAGAVPPLYFEAAAVVVTLVLFGKWLERNVRRRTGDAIRALQALRPETARIERHGQWLQVPVAQLQVGERMRVEAGERIPADGVVLEGRSHLDESLLTGESLPVARGVGDQVAGGAMNGEARLLIEARAVGAATLLGRTIQAVEEAQAKKAPLQRLVDRLSAVFVPFVLLLALATFGGWMLAGAALPAAIIHAVSVLVVACPCALGLATPTAIMAGTGVAARHGILIRDVETLENAQRIDIIAFDKTGTLTHGAPAVVDVLDLTAGHDAWHVLRAATRNANGSAAALAETIAANGATNSSDRTIVTLAAALQQGAAHPLARAVLAAVAGERLPEAQALQTQAGLGVSGRVAGRLLLLGNERAMREAGIVSPAHDWQAAREAQGNTVSWLADITPGAPPALLGALAFSDTLRADASAAVEGLRQMGLRTALLTGDNPRAAATIAQAVGIETVAASLLPHDKLDWIEAQRAQGAGVAMVGDGINDAPALAVADIGIALGSGTDVAVGAAAITLMGGELRRIADALQIARLTYRKIRQNLFWAFVYNLAALPLAAAGLLSPVVAGAAMAASSVCVVCNALWLTRWRPAAQIAGGR